jgi:hypothetical protein
MSIILNPKQGGYVTQYEMINFSKAKQKFSFSKSPRFPVAKLKETDCKPTPYYDLPGLFEGPNVYSARRAPSFGIGDRF